MVQTIAPVVHGGNRKRWARVVVLHVLGASVSAAAAGALLGAVGAIAGAPWGAWGSLSLTAVAVAYTARDLAGVPVPIPEARAQVPEWWRWHFSPGAAAFLYGLGLGVGFLTHLRHGTLVVVAVAAAGTGDPAVGAMVMAPFGLARALAVALAWGSGRDLGRVTDRLERIGEGRLPGVVNGLVLGVLAVVAVAGPIPGSSGRPSMAAVVLAGLLGWAVLAKTIHPARWRRALSAHGLPGALAPVAAVAVPLAEAVAAALLLAGNVMAGAILTLALLAAFSAALVRARRRIGSRVPCGCFGGSGTRDVRLLLARNAGVALLAAAAVASAGAASGPALPRGIELVPAGLAAAGALLGAWAVRWVAGPRGAGRAMRPAEGGPPRTPRARRRDTPGGIPAP